MFYIFVIKGKTYRAILILFSDFVKVSTSRNYTITSRSIDIYVTNKCRKLKLKIIISFEWEEKKKNNLWHSNFF